MPRISRALERELSKTRIITPELIATFRAEAAAGRRLAQRDRQRSRRHGGGFSLHAPRVLCLQCRVVNAHASGCTRDDATTFHLPIAARVPRATASAARWREFARAMNAIGFSVALAPRNAHRS